jgi:hypothetical protein
VLASVALATLAAGCAHKPARVASGQSTDQVDAGIGACPSSQHIHPASSSANLGERVYELTDAVWLEHAPIAVNEPFDFAMGLTGDAMGAGIAAGQRKRSNEAKSQQMATVALSATTRSRLDALQSCGIRAYGLLWGRPESVILKVVVEELGERETIELRRVVETSARPIAGSEGWAAADVLDRALRDGLDRALASEPAPARADLR